MKDIEKKVFNDISESVKAGVKLGDVLNRVTSGSSNNDTGFDIEFVPWFQAVNALLANVQLDLAALTPGNIIEVDRTTVEGTDVFECVDDDNLQRRPGSIPVDLSGEAVDTETIILGMELYSTQGVRYDYDESGFFTISTDSENLTVKVLNSDDEDISSQVIDGFNAGVAMTPIGENNRIVFTIDEEFDLKMYIGVNKTEDNELIPGVWYETTLSIVGASNGGPTPPA